MRIVVLIAALLVWPGLASAQHSHGTKGPNGGVMQDVAGVHAELVTAGAAITINVYDESNKPVAATGMTGSVLIVSGGERETVQLTASGNALKGEAKKPVAAGSAVTLVLRKPDGKSGQVKF
jgi:hypothetical protein